MASKKQLGKRIPTKIETHTVLLVLMIEFIKLSVVIVCESTAGKCSREQASSQQYKKSNSRRKTC